MWEHPTCKCGRRHSQWRPGHLGDPRGGQDQICPTLLHGGPCPAHAGANVHAEQQSTTHSNPCCPRALIVLSPQRVRPAVTADPGEGHGRRALRPARPPSTGRAVRHATSSVALQLCQPRRPTPHSAYVESAVELTRSRGQARRPPTGSVLRHGPVPRPVLQAPLKRVMRRHDSTRDSQSRTLELGLFKDVQATVEPRVSNPQTGADLRRGDIEVRQGVGRRVPRDPALRRRSQPGYPQRGSCGIKAAAKYVDQPNFVPFIWRREATSTAGPTSSCTPYRVPRDDTVGR
jgi:hypothetical protein